MIATLLAAVLVKPIVSQCPLFIQKAVANTFESLAKVNSETRDLAMAALDGKFISCKKCGSSNGECGKPSSGLDAPPKSPNRGKRPSGCTASTLPKMVFVNGIQNSPENNCETAQNLADTMCAEVVSFYNSTDGMASDLAECVSNISGDPNNMPARNLEKFLEDNENENITIVAHSQGGLITRQALNSRQRDLTAQVDSKQANEKMSKIKVISCGTAENGWPEGPEYEQYTNRMDVVPKAIAEADNVYAVPSTQPANTIKNRFFNFTGDKMLGHSMNDVYVPKIKENQAGKIPNNDCRTCSKKT